MRGSLGGWGVGRKERGFWMFFLVEIVVVLVGKVRLLYSYFLFLFKICRYRRRERGIDLFSFFLELLLVF